MKFFFILVNMVLFSSVFSLGSTELKKPIFKGSFVQGGLVIGKTTPNSLVILNGKSIRLSKEGFFLLGFGRNAKKNQIIKIIDPKKSAETLKLEIRIRKYKISRINGLPRNTVSPNPETLEKIKADNQKIRVTRTINSSLTGFLSDFTWPVRGRKTGIFGSRRILNGNPRRPHNGVDIAAPIGTPVVAAAHGVVSLTDTDMFLSGQTIMIDHGHGLSSIYIHLNQILVKAGDKILKGQKIGTVGMSGRTTGPHLHWGVALFDTHIDPELLVTK